MRGGRCVNYSQTRCEVAPPRGLNGHGPSHPSSSPVCKSSDVSQATVCPLECHYRYDDTEREDSLSHCTNVAVNMVLSRAGFFKFTAQTKTSSACVLTHCPLPVAQLFCKNTDQERRTKRGCPPFSPIRYWLCRQCIQ